MYLRPWLPAQLHFSEVRQVLEQDQPRPQHQCVGYTTEFTITSYLVYIMIAVNWWWHHTSWMVSIIGEDFEAFTRILSNFSRISVSPDNRRESVLSSCSVMCEEWSVRSEEWWVRSEELRGMHLLLKWTKRLQQSWNKDWDMRFQKRALTRERGSHTEHELHRHEFPLQHSPTSSRLFASWEKREREDTCKYIYTEEMGISKEAENFFFA